jgi:hypothetical protein
MDDPPGGPVGPKRWRGLGRRGNFQGKSIGLPKTFGPKTRVGLRTIFLIFQTKI